MAKGLANHASAKHAHVLRGAAALRLLCAATVGACLGCETLTLPSLAPRFLSQRSTENRGESQAAASVASNNQPAPRQHAADAAETSDDSAFEQEGVAWRLTAGRLTAGRLTAGAASSSNGYRWRHDGLEEVLSNANAPAERLATLARSPRPITAATARIGLARLEPATNASRLTAIVENENLPEALRSAALETYAAFKTDAAAAQLQKWQTQLEHSFRAEWLRAMAKHVSPDQHAAFTDALSASDNKTVVAALAAFAHWKITLPDDAAHLLNSPQPTLRLAALATVRAGVSPETVAEVVRLSLSPNPTTRREAILALGRIGDASSRTKLKELLQHHGENIRSAALAALAGLSDWDACEPLRNDDSWRVRQTLAQTLEHWPAGAQREHIARLLANDSSNEVRQTFVTSMQTWQPQESAPWLFFLLEDTQSPRLQQAALKVISEQLTDANDNNDDNNADAQHQAASPPELRKQWQRQFGEIASLATAKTSPPQAKHAPTFDASARDALEQVLVQYASAESAAARVAARRALLSRGDALAPQLEALDAVRSLTLPDALYSEVLAEASPLFAAIEQLNDEKASVRQASAMQIERLARLQHLPSIAGRRLAERLTREQDVSVWLKLLPLLAGNADQASLTAGYAAMSHPAAQVRRQAAEFLAASPHKNRAQSLAVLLQDSNPDVVAAAALALAKNREMGDQTQLRRLLRAPQIKVRLAGATALAAAKITVGQAALERLSRHAQPRVQRDAVLAMGKLADPTFLPTLIQRLDDAPSVRRAALTALSQIIGPAAPAPEQENPTEAEQADAWRSWFQQKELPAAPPKRAAPPKHAAD